MSRADGQLLTGAQALVESLERVGVEVAFGIPGGAILPAYDPLINSKIQHILVRHEQGGGHAAEGYAIASGKVGVCLATSGPGATNLVTAIGNAYMDSTPLVAITGQVNSTAIGTDAFQEADIRGIVMPITKHSFLIKHTKDIPLAIKEAFHIASTGRPGPVLVDIAKDALAAKAPFHWPEALDLPGYKPTVKPHIRQIRAAAKLISQSKRPVLYVGGGVVRAEAFKELAALVDKTQIPVVTTLMARGALPDSHPLHMGMPGMHGTVAAVGALQRSDLIIAVGTRFDDRVTGKLDSFAPGAKVIHADIRTVDVPIVGDCRQTLALLADEIDRVPDDAAWVQTLEKVKERYQPCWEEAPDGELSPQEVVQRIGQLSPADSIYVTGVGQHQMWAAQYYPVEKPRTFLTSGSLGTMGFGLPAAIGASLSHPECRVVCVSGDGSILMNIQELATLSEQNLAVTVIVFDNGTLGMVYQQQKYLFGGTYAASEFSHRVDFVEIARGFGIEAVDAAEDEKWYEKAFSPKRERKPFLVRIEIDSAEDVLPFVLPGKANIDALR